VAAFEYLYLPRLHRKGYVAPNLGELESDIISPGGYVMNSRPGIYDNILVLDFKSLYPSIIRTFLIDPCAFWIAEHEDLLPEQTVEGFNGARFAREGHILPQIIEHLWSARDTAKREKNAPLSHAIKIIMNSFYGVLGSTGCRFFDPRVCSSITLRGHDIIQRSRDWIEQQGYAVIYGDTDSLFVWVENNCVGKPPKTKEQCQKIGDRLARELNQWWQATLHAEHRIKSHLEIQFETHYFRFLMPTIRGSELGTKKRYAGVIEHHGESEVVFKGLENVRTDWTKLAKDFQEQLYTKIFAGEDYLDYVRETVADVLAGKRNNDLVYNKRLRRHLHEYEKNVPPQVQAARKYVQLTGKSIKRGDWIAYVITTSGAEPIAAQQSPLDYQHYVDKQLMPVADSILHFLEQNMTELVDAQMSLFAS
jgi:DNA polymerase-2